MVNMSGVKRFIKNLVMENVHDHYDSSFHLNFLCTDRSLSVLHRILVALSDINQILIV